MTQIISKYFALSIFFAGILLFAPNLSFSAGDTQQQDSDVPTDYMIVVTGGELLRGVYADAHTLYLTQTLGPLGCRCVGSMCVGDDAKDLTEALAYASGQAGLIIVTGGLGPTDDDITRETLSKFTGIPLRENSDVVNAMMRRFGVQNKNELRKNLLRQTLTPESGAYLPNPEGTAVGLVFEKKKQVIVALPGPPRELKPMVKDRLVPYLAERFGIHTIGCSLTMRFVGIGESQIDQVMHENLVLPKDVMISSLFEFGRVDLTLSLPGDSPDDLARLETLESDLLKHIGEYMYSDDGSTLEDCVIRMLAKRNASLVTAEVGSGGAIATNLNHAKGASSVYSGGYVAPSDRAMATILDLPVDLGTDSQDAAANLIKTIAERSCEKTDSDWGLVVGQANQTENDPRFVWVAFGTRQEGFEVEPMSLRGHGETEQNHLVNQALDLLRRRLAGIQR
ncbi:MAG: molybdopterin-binding protein [bacterium]